MIVDRAPQATRCVFCHRGISGIAPDVKVCVAVGCVTCFACAWAEFPDAFALNTAGKLTDLQAQCRHDGGRTIADHRVGFMMKCLLCGKTLPPRLGID
jgi:hypothetical protein